MNNITDKYTKKELAKTLRYFANRTHLLPQESSLYMSEPEKFVDGRIVTSEILRRVANNLEHGGSI